MKYTRICSVFFLACLLFQLASCDDFFEKDISKKSIQAQSPSDGSELLNTQVSFVWNEEEGVDAYHIILVSPSFDSIQSYVCDTLLSGNHMKLNLPVGKYQWSIQAENFGYQSLVSYMSFKVSNNEK